MELLIGTEKDVDELGQLLWDFNRSIFPQLNNVDKDKPDEKICYLMKDKNKIIAGIVGKILKNHLLYVDIIFVEEVFRKQDYATFMLNKLEADAKSRGCYLAFLETMNIEAVSFYEKCGYSIFGKLDDCPCPGICYFWMRKDI